MIGRLKMIWLEIRLFPSKVAKCFSYLPVIYTDEDFDHIFFFMLMRHKLIRMEKDMRFGPTVDGTQCADQIRICIEALDRLIADDYLKDNRPNWTLADKLQQEDLSLVFDTMKKHVLSWWN